jgi:tetratricopeptide (TPR) repeat protein
MRLAFVVLLLFANLLSAANPAADEQASSFLTLGAIYQNLGRQQEAETAYLRALATDPSSAEAMNDLASLYFEMHQYARAEKLLLGCLRASGSRLATARLRGNLAVLYQAERRYAEAQENYAAARELYEVSNAASTPEMAYVLHNLGSLRLQAGDSEAAMQYSEHAVEIWRESLGPENPIYAEGLAQLAIIYARCGRRADADAAWMRSVGVLEKALGPGHPTTVRVLEAYAAFLRQSGKKAAARKIHRRISAGVAAPGVVDYRELLPK